MNKKQQIITTSIFAAASVFLAVGFFVWTLVPYIQMASFYSNASGLADRDQSSISSDDGMFTPMTYMQPQIRAALADFILLNNDKLDSSIVLPLVQLTASKIPEVDTMEGNNIYTYLTFGKLYDLLGDLDVAHSAQNYALAEKEYQKALAVYPGYQKTLYVYSINLAHQGRMQDAMTQVQLAYDEDPRVPASHYYLGMILFLSDNTKNSNAALENFEFALDRTSDQMPGATKVVYEKMLNQYYTAGDIVRFQTVVNRLIALDPSQSQVYQKISDYVTANHVIPIINLNK